MKQIQILKGVATYIPGFYKTFYNNKTGGTNSARYCYSVFMRHLIHANKNGLNTNPKVVAELGPGDSIGVGLCALLAGADKYYAFDVVKYADLATNLSVFDELVSLFKRKENIPGNEELKVFPELDTNEFPSYILTNERIEKSLERVETIRNSLITDDNRYIEYHVPWYARDQIQKESIDMIISQAVLEHVDDLKNIYEIIYQYLKVNGYLTSEIDLSSHNMADKWNGHWGYSNFEWRLIRGNRPYFLNREPYSVHLKYISDAGLNVITQIRRSNLLGIERRLLAKEYKYLTDEDMQTCEVFIQVAK